MQQSIIRLIKYVCVFFIIFGCSDIKKSKDEPSGAENLAYKWGKVALEATANNTEQYRPRPTVTSRILALVWTAVYDAWSRYDAKAIPVYLKNVERVPENERTIQNKEKAISYAAYRAMLTYFFSDSVMLRTKMKEFGFNPDDISLDPKTPEGIGNLAAKTIIETKLINWLRPANILKDSQLVKS